MKVLSFGNFIFLGKKIPVKNKIHALQTSRQKRKTAGLSGTFISEIISCSAGGTFTQ
jgi:hypothetical protein